MKKYIIIILVIIIMLFAQSCGRIEKPSFEYNEKYCVKNNYSLEDLILQIKSKTMESSLSGTYAYNKKFFDNEDFYSKEFSIEFLKKNLISTSDYEYVLGTSSVFDDSLGNINCSFSYKINNDIYYLDVCMFNLNYITDLNGDLIDSNENIIIDENSYSYECVYKNDNRISYKLYYQKENLKYTIALVTIKALDIVDDDFKVEKFKEQIAPLMTKYMESFVENLEVISIYVDGDN